MTAICVTFSMYVVNLVSKLYAAETTSSCHVPSVPEMEPTTLTCNFSVDVSATRRDFRVIHLKSQDKKGNIAINIDTNTDHCCCFAN